MPSFSENTCPVCGSQHFLSIGPSSLGDLPIEKRATSVVKCRDCDSYYANPMPHWTREDFEVLYGHDYFGGGSAESSHEVEIRMQNVRFRFSQVLRHIRNDRKSVLEVGAGIQAYMAKYLLEKGWSSVTAQEPSSAISGILKRNTPKLEVITDDLLRLASRSYALVYADSVLEHTPAPLDYVRKIATLLEPGGVAYFVVPNEHSFFNFVITLANRVRGRSSVKYLCPYTDSYHLIGFSEKGIRKLAEQSGLELAMHFRKRDLSWARFTHMDWPLLIKYPSALVFSLADFLGYGCNQEFVLRKPVA